MCEQEESLRGPDEDFTRLKKVFFERVIPRYLRPMESDGRSIEPCLIHNDLWPGNVKPRTDSPDTVAIVDSAAIWGHFEGFIPLSFPRFALRLAKGCCFS
jgi:hypothetical protein